jgi:hypothetical protein
MSSAKLVPMNGYLERKCLSWLCTILRASVPTHPGDIWNYSFVVHPVTRLSDAATYGASATVIKGELQLILAILQPRNQVIELTFGRDVGPTRLRLEGYFSQ